MKLNRPLPSLLLACVLIAFNSGCSIKTLNSQELSNSVELHMIGVYEAEDSQGSFRQHNSGNVLVKVNRVGVPLILSLSSYEPVNWQVQLADEVKLQQVIVSGYHPQSVEGLPADVNITKKIFLDRDADSFFFYKDDREQVYEVRMQDNIWKCSDELSRNTPSYYSNALKSLKTITGLSPYSVQGAYSGRNFSIEADTKGSYLSKKLEDGLCYKQDIGKNFPR